MYQRFKDPLMKVKLEVTQQPKEFLLAFKLHNDKVFEFGEERTVNQFKKEWIDNQECLEKTSKVLQMLPNGCRRLFSLLRLDSNPFKISLKNSEGHIRAEELLKKQYEKELATKLSSNKAERSESQTRRDDSMTRLLRLLDDLESVKRPEIYISIMPFDATYTACIEAVISNSHLLTKETPSRVIQGLTSFQSENDQISYGLGAGAFECSYNTQGYRDLLDGIQILEQQKSTAEENAKTLTHQLAAKTTEKEDLLKQATEMRAALSKEVSQHLITSQKYRENEEHLKALAHPALVQTRRLQETGKRVDKDGRFLTIKDCSEPNGSTINDCSSAIHSAHCPSIWALRKRHLFNAKADIEWIQTSCPSGRKDLSPKQIQINSICLTLRNSCYLWTEHANSKDIDDQVTQCKNSCIRIWEIAQKMKSKSLQAARNAFENSIEVRDLMNQVKEHEKESSKLQRLRSTRSRYLRDQD